MGNGGSINTIQPCGDMEQHGRMDIEWIRIRDRWATNRTHGRMGWKTTNSCRSPRLEDGPGQQTRDEENPRTSSVVETS